MAWCIEPISDPIYLLQSISDLPISSQSMQSKVAFKKNILKYVLTSKNLSALRCLQYLSIVVLFEIISSAFVEEYDFMVQSTQEITDDLPDVKVLLSDDLATLRTRIFFECFSPPLMDFPARGFQLKHGYAYFAKYIVQFCGLLGPPAVKLVAAKEKSKSVKSTTGDSSNKRRKVQEATGGDWREVNETNISTATVRLPGEGTILRSCSNFFIYLFLFI